MMNEIIDNRNHLYDGTDPDAPRHRLSARGLCQDLADLREMSEADIQRYSATPGGSKGKPKSRG